VKILLVDDSPKHRKAGIEDLTALGHEVVAKSDYTEARSAVSKERYDVALLDLLMPAEATTLGGEGLSFFGQPFPVGYPLAVSMALEGVKFVAVATDTNHHSHPASAAMDWFRGQRFFVQDSSVLFLHAPMCSGGVKDWAEVLRRLTADSEPE